MGKQELLDRARDELFSHIHRCGVLTATEPDQDSWMTETIEYLAERYPDLGVTDLTDLRAVGLRFCKPVISRLSKEEPSAEESEVVAEGEAVEGEPVPVDATEVATPEAAAPVVEPLDAEVPAKDSEAAVGAA